MKNKVTLMHGVTYYVYLVAFVPLLCWHLAMVLPLQLHNEVD